MRVRCAILVFISFSLFSPVVAQSLVSQILNAHGGANGLAKAGKYQISGMVTRAGQTAPFALKADGANTRFEEGNRVLIKRGMAQQLVANSRRWYSRPVQHGEQDLYLVPFLALRELSSKYQTAGRVDGKDAFAHRPRLDRFIAHEPDTPVIRAAFDPETHLLAEVAFLTEEGARRPVRYVYSDYASFGGLIVAQRVEHWIGDRLMQEFAIQSVDFNPVLSTNDFTIER